MFVPILTNDGFASVRNRSNGMLFDYMNGTTMMSMAACPGFPGAG
jgi:hypothetical protein